MEPTRTYPGITGGAIAGLRLVAGRTDQLRRRAVLHAGWAEAARGDDRRDGAPHSPSAAGSTPSHSPMWREAVNALAQGVILLDVEGHILSANPAALRLLGPDRAALRRRLDDALGRQVRATAAPDDDQSRQTPVVLHIMSPEGARRWVEFTTAHASMDGLCWLVVGVHDVTTYREAEEALTAQARRDALTGLGNRLLLIEQGRQLLDARQEASFAALLLLDLDGFKAINDSYGHHQGDQALVEVGQRLCQVVQGTGGTGTVVRLSGDEFAVLAPGVDAEGALRLARSCRRALLAPFDLDGTPCALGASIGVALAPAHGRSTQELLRAADAAMYRAKRGGHGYAVSGCHPTPDAAAPSPARDGRPARWRRPRRRLFRGQPPAERQ